MPLVRVFVVMGVLLAAETAYAKDIVVEKVPQVACSSCHQDTKKISTANAEVPCSSCHLDFVAGALPATGAARKPDSPVGKQ